MSSLTPDKWKGKGNVEAMEILEIKILLGIPLILLKLIFKGFIKFYFY